MSRLGFVSIMSIVSVSFALAAGCSSKATDAKTDDAGPTPTIDAAVDAAVDADGGSAPPDPAAVAAACGRYATALCGLLGKCDENEPISRFGKKENCAPRVTLDCTTRFALRDVAIDVVAVDACATALASAACASVLYDALPAACNLPKGKRANGDACIDRAQCASGHCEAAKSGACGTCTDVPAPGAKCRARFMESGCGPGQTCESDTCGTLVALGDACDPSHHCGAGFSCTKGKCVKAAGIGDTCDLADPNAPSCDWGEVCNPVCQPINVLPYDEPDCATIPRSVCGGQAACNGSCVAPPVEGKPCNAAGSSEGEKCRWPAVCESGACVLPDASTCR